MGEYPCEGRLVNGAAMSVVRNGLVAWFLLATCAFAQDQCQDAAVLRIEQKITKLHHEWCVVRVRDGRGTDGGYDLRLSVDMLPPRLAEQQSLIQRCADVGDAHARYLCGWQFERNAGSLLALAEDQEIRQFYPLQATLARESANKSYTEANRWFTLAANQGHLLAMIAIALSYAEGKGLSPNKLLAIEWLNKAANRANEAGSRDYAVLCLERMNALDANHPLTKALTKTLYGRTVQ